MLRSIVLLLLPLLAAGATIQRRHNCKTFWMPPSAIWPLDKTDPDGQQLRFSTNGTKTIVYHNDTQPWSDWFDGRDPHKIGVTVDTVFEFSNIPAGSESCRIAMYFDKGYQWGDIQGFDEKNVFEVWSVDRELAPPQPNDPKHPDGFRVTWNDSPQRVAILDTASINLPEAPADGIREYQENVMVQIRPMGAPCASKMTYRMGGYSREKAGGVWFEQRATPPRGGWFLWYDKCS